MRSQHFLIANALVAVATASAQSPPCHGVNATTNVASAQVSPSGAGGENSWAWQFVAPQNLAVQGIRGFTQNAAAATPRFMAFELRADAAGSPGSLLGRGSWQIDPTRGAAWQGASLDHAVALAANTPAWLIWREPGQSQLMVEPGGSALPHRVRLNGSPTWTNAAPSPAKFRLFCNLLDDIHSTPFGVPCQLSTGAIATVYNNSPAGLGNSAFRFESSGHAPGTLMFFVLGLDPGWTPMPVPFFPVGCTQNTDRVGTVLTFAGTGDTRGPTFSGYASLSLPLPTDPGLAGIMLAGCTATLDPGATSPAPFGTSNAQRVVLH